MVGEIGLTFDVFYDCTWQQVDNVIAGYSKKLEREERRSWEQTRFSLMPYIKKGQSLVDVFPFPWEKSADADLLDEDVARVTAQELQAHWDEIDKKRKKQ